MTSQILKLHMVKILVVVIILVNGVCLAVMLRQYFKQSSEKLSLKSYLKLTISGFIAFCADTIGLGSFAVNIALAKILKTFRDEELPALNNGAQVLPGLFEALFFIKLVDVDVTTLVVLVSGTCLGGLVGGSLVSRLSSQAIRLTMLICFGAILVILALNMLEILPFAGNLIALHGYKLGLGFLAMFICGTLTSAGIGLFAMVQAVLFMLNVSALVAFPIMMVAGALQQPLTTLVFIKRGTIPLKRTLILSLAGTLAVICIAPFFTSLDQVRLHLILCGILTFNLVMLGRDYLKGRNKNHGKK